MTEEAKLLIPFGKFKGQSLADIEDVGYLNWSLKTGTGDPDSFVGRFVARNGDALKARVRELVSQVAASYTLHPSQVAAVDAIDAAVLQGNTPCARLDGGAGYGKSFTTLDVVRRAQTAGYEVQACATSYVATQVLGRMLERIGVRPRTIASLCRLDKIDDEDRESYEVTEHTHEQMADLLKRGHLLVLDEWSMVGDEIAQPLIDYATRLGGKLLVVGDSHQLPPVGQREASAFASIEPVVELREPMRFSRESDLYTLEQLARWNPRALYDDSEMYRGEGVHRVRSSDEMFAQFCIDYRDEPLDDARILYFRRSDVMHANESIRYRLFGDDSLRTPVVDDERVMVTATTDVGRNPLTGAEGVRYYSGETFHVDRVVEATVADIPCYVAHFHGRDAPVPIMLPQGDARGRREYQVKLGTLRDSAKASGDWRAFRAFRNTFCPIGYSYAMTVHRCQGQTVDRCYFDPVRLQHGSMGAALTYVAATRAKSHVHILRP